MDESISLLAFTALSIGAVHTLAGPDHYLPFVAMSRSRNWSVSKTVNIVIICGLGHVLSSVVIGFIGIAAGVALARVEWIEGVRGNIAAWLLLLFGLGYFLWGFYRYVSGRNFHHHAHGKDHTGSRQMTFWILFTIFVFGPCEPLIPILLYPASNHNYVAVVIIAAIFALATLITMTVIVLLLLKGVSSVRFGRIEKYQHMLAGLTIAACGAAIVFLGL